MARKKKEESRGVERVISGQQFVALIKDGRATKGKTSELAGKFGERVKNAVENANLDRKAFSYAMAVAGMEPFRQQQFLRNCSLYVDMLREAGLVREDQTEMELDQPETSADDEAGETEGEAPLDTEEQEQVATNVRRLRRNIKQLPADEQVKDEAAAGSTTPEEAAAARPSSGVTLQ